MSRRLDPRPALRRRLQLHRQALRQALANLRAAPLPNLFTLLAIAVALALPTGTWLALHSLGDLGGRFDPREIDVFLQPDRDDAAARRLADSIAARPDVAEVTVIGRAQALAEFRATSGLGEALDLLPDNPLPAVLVVRPAATVDSPERLAALAAELGRLAGVDAVEGHHAWVQKVYALLRSLQRLSVVVASLFALLVALVIYIVLRVEVLERRQEIEVSKLVGADDAFVRRPFLYNALFTGLGGALLGLGLVALAFAALDGPLRAVAALYDTPLQLRLPLGFALRLLLAAGALSVAAAWLALALLLRRIRP